MTYRYSFPDSRLDTLLALPCWESTNRVDAAGSNTLNSSFCPVVKLWRVIKNTVICSERSLFSSSAKRHLKTVELLVERGRECTAPAVFPMRRLNHASLPTFAKHRLPVHQSVLKMPLLPACLMMSSSESAMDTSTRLLSNLNDRHSEVFNRS